jgi:adenylate kinase family enzyme
VYVTGASCNGKSTLGRALAERLGVPYTELDALHHGPSWTEATADELRGRVEAAMAASDGWVIDGGYRAKLGDLLWERADTVVWLDQPLPLIMGRLLRRTHGRIRHDVELWNGNRESWRNMFWGRDTLFWWTVRAHFRHRREYPALMERFSVVRLRTPQEVQAFLDGAAGSGTPPATPQPAGPARSA